MGDKHRW